MLEDRFYDLIKQTFPLKVIVHASYDAKQTLAGKGLTPAIFLSTFYKNKPLYSQQVGYNFKDKTLKPMPEISTIDYDQYQKYSQDNTNKCIRYAVSSAKSKNPKDIQKGSLQNKTTIENFLNNLNFYWFQNSIKQFFYSLTLSQNYNRISTLEQPKGIAFILQVNNKSVKQNFQKIKNQVENLMKRMYFLNPSQLKAIPIAVIIFFDPNKKHDFPEAKRYTQALKSDYGIQTVLQSKLQINGEKSIDTEKWSDFNRVIFHQKYNLTASDPIKLLTEQGMNNVLQTVNIHKQRIKKMIENRLDYLLKRYDDNYSIKTKFFGIFKSSAPSQKHLVTEQAQGRQIADLLFVLEDYKNAYDVYNNICKQFKARQKAIDLNLRFMIQVCILMGKFHNIKVQSHSVKTLIERDCQDLIFKTYQELGRVQLTKYLVFLMFQFHTFKYFDPQIVKDKYNSYLKKTLTMQQKEPTSQKFLIPVLLYEQYANLNLLYPYTDYRRYCYDIVRVGMKFSEYKLITHTLRCLSIVDKIYMDTFPSIQKYVSIHLSNSCVQNKKYVESYQNIKKAWQFLLESRLTDFGRTQQAQLTKMISNHNKIINQLQKYQPELLNTFAKGDFILPNVLSIDMQLEDQKTLEEPDRSGVSWNQISDFFSQNNEIYSQGYNKSSMEKLFRSLDCTLSEQKQLIYRLKANVLTQPMIKKNIRASYVNEPILVTIYLQNPLNYPIQICNLELIVKNSYQNFTYESNTNCEKIVLEQLQKQVIVFKILPKKEGIFQLIGVQWKFQKMSMKKLVRQPQQSTSELKPLYYKINILSSLGKLVVQTKPHPQFYEGQIGKNQITLKNTGADKIDFCYIAFGSNELYDKKTQKLDLNLSPGETKTISLNFKMPLAPKGITNIWRFMNRMIFLYKTNSNFRVTRLSTQTTVNKLYSQEIICEKLSTHLHLLTYSYESHSNNQNLIKSLIIKKGFQISKVDMTKLQNKTTYYFFLKSNDFSRMQKYLFNDENPNKQIFNRIQQKQSRVDTQKCIQIVQIWRKDDKHGCLQIQPLQISSFGKRVLPFSFSFSMPYEIQNDFSINPVFQLSILMKLKNIYHQEGIQLAIYFDEYKNAGVFWQGKTQTSVKLKFNKQQTVEIKLIICSEGIYDISESIKYITTVKKQNKNITHSEYQKIFLRVVDTSLKFNPIVSNQYSNTNSLISSDIISPKTGDLIDLL